jgi:Reverse transcriptase (RNA-dependent DNA polymerase)
LDDVYDSTQFPTIKPTALPTPKAPNKSWICDYFWRLIDQRALLRRQDRTDTQDQIHDLSQQLRKRIRRNRKRRTIQAGYDIEKLLDEQDLPGAWAILRRWYRQVTHQVSKPSITDMDQVHTTFSSLYQLPATPGPSGLRAEQVQTWMKDQNDQTKWNTLTSLIQQIFVSGEVPQRLAFSTLCLLPKPDGGVQGIGLLETVWKIISIIIKDRITEHIHFDDSLHGFLPTRGTSMAIIDAKLRLDTHIATGQTLHHVFIDISKAYDSVSRAKLLHIMQQYGIGNNTIKLLHNFWSKLWVAPRQAGFYGNPIKSDRGVTQGDPLSPILFNILIDAIVRETKRIHGHHASNIIFYADDGLITGTDPVQLQNYLNTMTTLFLKVGLQINSDKTKIMIARPHIPNHRMCSPVFHRRFGGDAPAYADFIKQQVICSICQLTLQRVSLSRHMLIQHNQYELPTRRSTILPTFNTPPETYYIHMSNQEYLDCPVPTCPANYAAHTPCVNILIIDTLKIQSS